MRPHVLGRSYVLPGRQCRNPVPTANRKGLQDALRAIVAVGETINTDSEFSPILHVGDQATGTTVLSDLYQRWKDVPVNVNLDQLWHELGIQIEPHGIELDSGAPLAEIRNTITSTPLHRQQSQ